MPNIEVYPKLGETYPDAGGVPITSVGAIVASSKYVEDALRDGFLLTWDPLNIYNPDDRTSLGGNAPATAPYVTIGADAILTAERVLTAGAGITITDGGANGLVTIAASGGAGAVSSVFGRIGAVVATLGDYTSSLVNNASAVAGATVTAALETLSSAISSLSSSVTSSLAGKAPVNAEYLVSTANAELTAERVLTAGTGISLTPSAGALTVATPNAVQGPASSTLNAIAKFADASGKSVVNTGITINGLNDIAMPAGSTVDGVDVSALGSTVSTLNGTVNNLVSGSYLVVGANATLSAERVLTAGTGISFSDGGGGGNFTINATTPAGAPTTPSYVLLGTDATLPNERVLTAGTGVTVTDGGAGSSVTVAAPGIAAAFVTLATHANLPNERVLTGAWGLVLIDGGSGSSVYVGQRTPVENKPGAFSVNAGNNDNNNKVFRYSGPGSITVTVEPFATNPVDPGFVCEIFNDSSNSGSVVTVDGSVTFVGQTGKPFAIDYRKGVRLINLATDLWWVRREDA